MQREVARGRQQRDSDCIEFEPPTATAATARAGPKYGTKLASAATAPHIIALGMPARCKAKPTATPNPKLIIPTEKRYFEM